MAFPTTEEGWHEEAKRMLKAINSAPDLFALESLMAVMKPKLAALKDFSETAYEHLMQRAELRRRAMTEGV